MQTKHRDILNALIHSAMGGGNFLLALLLWAVGSACFFFIFSLEGRVFGLVFGTAGSLALALALWRGSRP